MAHPFDDGTAVTLERSVERTAAALGQDAQAYTRLMAPTVENARALLVDLLGPFRPPRHPLLFARFGMLALLPATVLARLAFKQTRAKALLASLAAHSILPLERPASAAFGLVLGMLGHAVGWPVVRGGSQHLANALAGYFDAVHGDIRTTCNVSSLDQLPPHRVALLDLTPRQLLQVTGASLPDGYRHQLARYRYGPGVCKVDWALEHPIPWTAEACRLAGTVQLGGTLEEVAASEAAAWRGEHSARPFVILAQPTVVDPSRSPPGRHTAWAYCHVPNGSTVDMTATIEAQIERFAPGFSTRILARSTLTASQMEAYNPNYVGGDINGGMQDLTQLWTRPAPRLVPYSTPHPKLFICSSATPPGGGVHGMCGVHAARAALRRLR
jgi:phytoene dehydrogenase-like protein